MPVEKGKQITIKPCRFYEEQYPKANDFVTSIEDTAAYVTLLEYNRKEGMITPNEFTEAKKQLQVNRALKLGKQEAVRVLRVDVEKGYIDLSKKRVSASEQEICRDKFAKANLLNSILMTICYEKEDPDLLESLYETLVWPLYRQGKHPLDVLKQAITNPSVLDTLEASDEIKQILMVDVQRRLTPGSLKIKAELEITCQSYEGVEAIKRALLAGEAVSKPNMKVKFHITGSPVYEGSVNTQNAKEGIELINEALKQVERTIIAEKGTFKIKSEVLSYFDEQPRIYGDKGQEDASPFGMEDDDEDQNSESEDSEVEGMGAADSEDEEH